MIFERLLRAGAAVIAGLGIAREHLRSEPTSDEAAGQVDTNQLCPGCGQSLAEGPHIHDDLVVWTTEHEGAFLITDLRGRAAAVIPGAEQ